MNAKCKDERGNLKRCPFLVGSRESKSVYGAYTEQSFMRCIGESCIAYHDGVCLRLARTVKR